MFDIKKLIEDIENNVKGLSERQIRQIVDVLEIQPQADKCSDCSRRKFYQQGYQDGLNADWIPCEERLPSENIEVLVTVEEIDGGKYTKTSWLQEEQWVIKKTPLEPKVIAWQPLPAPYKKEGELNA